MPVALAVPSLLTLISSEAARMASGMAGELCICRWHPADSDAAKTTGITFNPVILSVVEKPVLSEAEGIPKPSKLTMLLQGILTKTFLQKCMLLLDRLPPKKRLVIYFAKLILTQFYFRLSALVSHFLLAFAPEF